jgi:radical SAM protein with 4Fe4S-binding SPASM domain
MTDCRLAPSFLPATGVLEMTYRCNHACLFCSCPWYAGAIPEDPEMPAAEWKELIAELCRRGVCNFAFTGGEPLLKEGIEEIIEFAASQQSEYIETVDGQLKSWFAAPKLFLLSNGKSMSREILALCKKHSINLSMSLPGLATFPEHTQGGTTAEQVLGWFREAKAAGVTTTVGVTVTSKNLQELYETLATALLAGADTVLLNRFMPGGRGLKHRDLELSREQLTQMVETAEDVLRQAGRYGSIGTELPLCLVDPSKYTHLKVGTRCSAALDFFVVDPSGYTRVCNHSQVRLNHWREIDKLKDNPYWRRFTQKDYLPKPCFSCPQMGECDGGCREAAHIIGGSLDAIDPLLISV